MGLLPDWNSIESTTRWSEALFWVGIVALILIVATELAAHVYSNRVAYLVSAHDRIEVEGRRGQKQQIERPNSAESASLQQKLDSANEEKARLVQKLDSANEEKANLQQKLDNANEETASLQQKLDVAIAELQNAKSNKARHLFDEQVNELLKSLAPFAGQKIKIWCSDTAYDSIPLGREFIAVLKMAGWVVPDSVLTGPVAGGDTDGIRVIYEGDLSNTSQIPRGINTLIATLGRFGFLTSQTLYLEHSAHGGEYVLKIGRIPAPARTKS